MSVLKQVKVSSGTSVVLVDDNNCVKNWRVNKLVLSTFRPVSSMNSSDLCAVRKDGDKFNNALWNLEWRTRCQIINQRVGKDCHGIPVILQKFEHNQLIDTIKCKSIAQCTRKINDFFDTPIKYPRRNMIGSVEFVDTNSISSKRCLVQCQRKSYPQEIDHLDDNEVWKLFLIGKVKQRYYVSSYGRVKVVVNGNKREKQLSITSVNGYNLVKLHVNGKPKWFRIHRLVSQLFVKNPYGYQTIDHIDGNRTNNRASNLRFVENQSQNMRNPVTIAKKINPNPILQIDK